MPEFRVRWEIDEDARSPLAAARKARRRMLNANSVADVFEVESSKARRVIQIDFHAAEFGEKPEAPARRLRSYDLSSEQIATIHQALRLALHLSGQYFTLSPVRRKGDHRPDYGRGHAATQHAREEIARDLLGEFLVYKDRP